MRTEVQIKYQFCPLEICKVKDSDVASKEDWHHLSRVTNPQRGNVLSKTWFYFMIQMASTALGSNGDGGKRWNGLPLLTLFCHCLFYSASSLFAHMFSQFILRKIFFWGGGGIAPTKINIATVLLSVSFPPPQFSHTQPLKSPRSLPTPHYTACEWGGKIARAVWD